MPDVPRISSSRDTLNATFDNPKMPDFFPLPRGDRWFILSILAFAVVAFLPWTHTIEVAGMALFGWMMAALMVVAPIVALVRLKAQSLHDTKQDIAS